MRTDFCIFVLSHGRPNRVITWPLLDRCGYTGKRYIVCDDEDTALPQYQSLFGDVVLVFSKSKYDSIFDVGDNFSGHRGVVYARNACFDLAEQVGCRYFLVLDDDYHAFSYKFDGYFRYMDRKIRNLDSIILVTLNYFIDSPFASIAFGQTGDFIGGGAASYAEAILSTRKVMNSFFCATDRRFSFVGRINEDVNTYVSAGLRGGLFLSIMQISINQLDTQSNAGGLTEFYLDIGTYVKSFYTVMYAPSCTKVSEMGAIHRRLHHSIKWDAAVPKILSTKHRKP